MVDNQAGYDEPGFFDPNAYRDRIAHIRKRRLQVHALQTGAMVALACIAAYAAAEPGFLAGAAGAVLMCGRHAKKKHGGSTFSHDIVLVCGVSIVVLSILFTESSWLHTVLFAAGIMAISGHLLRVTHFGRRPHRPSWLRGQLLWVGLAAIQAYLVFHWVHYYLHS